MRGAHHLEPLRRVHLVRADHRPHLVVEDLRRGAGQCAKPGILQLRQEIAQRQPERRRALRHLQRRERMHVHIRQRVLDRAADAEIGRAGVVGMDAALQAHFGRAALPCFLRPPHHFVQRQIVRRAAQCLVRLALGEGAELAAVVADVGVVDVAVDDVAHDVAADRLAQRIGRGDDMLVVGIARGEQAHDLGLVRAARRRPPSTTASPTAGSTVRSIGARCFGSTVSPGAQSSSRAHPSASIARRTRVAMSGAHQRSASNAYAGYTGSRCTSTLPIAAVRCASASICGHGASGLT